MRDAPDAGSIVQDISEALVARGNPERAVAEKRYLKSSMDFLGTGVPAVRAAVRAVRRRYPDLGRETVLEVAEGLWDTTVHERRTAAVELLIAYGGRLSADDIDVVERLVRQAGTWALVDPLSSDIAGPLVERYPELGATLDRWVTDPDFWIRRAALLTLLPALRRGEGDVERFTRYADLLLEEREFFIRKAIGWVLREMGKKRPGLVASWLRPRAQRASGVTVREAVKYLDPEQREEILATYRTAGRR